MKLSETFVTNRIIDVVESCTKVSQAFMAQRYCYMLIAKIEGNMGSMSIILMVRDMCEIKIKSIMDRICGVNI